MPGGRRRPLERAFRELADVRRAVGHGRPLSLDEAIHVAGELSRRDLLRMGGVAGACLLLAACTRDGGSTPPLPSPAEGGPRIVVAGAGLAGLTAAYRLVQAGADVKLFESRDRVGGRCWTARGFADGQTAEHGGEFIDTRHVHVLGLIDELGLEVDDLWKGWVSGSIWP
ncbi:MAG: flavin monoamine oxidase family protein, partial [Actinomycetota bacterium]